MSSWMIAGLVIIFSLLIFLLCFLWWMIFGNEILHMLSLGRFTKKEKELNKKFLDGLDENIMFSNDTILTIYSTIARVRLNPGHYESLIFDYVSGIRKDLEKLNEQD